MIYLMQSRGWLALRFFLTPVNFAANRDLLSECQSNLRHFLTVRIAEISCSCSNALKEGPSVAEPQVRFDSLLSKVAHVPLGL